MWEGGEERVQGKKSGSVSTWKENMTKKVGFGFMGIKQFRVGLCTLVRPLCLRFLVLIMEIITSISLAQVHVPEVQ